MRLRNLFLFGAAALAIASPPSADTEEDITRENTYFNGKKVPPILELTPANYKEELKKSKFLMVKHFRYYARLLFGFLLY